MPEQVIFGRRMTASETMMWHVEDDPWLAPSGGSLAVFDRPLDPYRFRRVIAAAVAAYPRLRQRVVEASSLSAPFWEPDLEFDLDWHVRRVGAPGAGSLADVFEWMTTFLEDPYDRTRPLWQYVLIDGLQGGRGALASRTHHVVIDGEGAVRMAESFVDMERDAPERPDVDLTAVLAADAGDRRSALRRTEDTLVDALALPWRTARALTGRLRRPGPAREVGREASSLVRTARDQLGAAGSPLWQRRSRRRHALGVSIPFDAAHTAAHRLGGTLNDLFLAGVVEAAARYHADLGISLEHLHTTFVVSTRGHDASGSNQFTPIPVDLPAAPMSLGDRFAAVRDRLRARRADVHGGGPMSTVAAVANLLPGPLVTSTIRSQARHIDLATSNVPGYLGDTYVAGAKTLHTFAFGPVAGTAGNLTLFTTAGSCDIGVHLDPVAVVEPERFGRALEDALLDLLALPT